MFFKMFPGLKQLLPYQISNLSGDITAGVIVTFLLLPQSMAYAMIAGVPISMGLIAGTFPLIIYALFGSSRYLSVGPVSIVSLLAFTGVSQIALVNSERFLEVMILLSLMVGIVQIIMALLHFGSLIKYVSSAIIGGFTSALAIIIILNQMNLFMGVTLPPYDNFLSFSLVIIRHIPQMNLLTFVFGIFALLFLLILKNKFLVSPGPFIIIIISILVADYFNLENRGVEVVGEIPNHFSNVSLATPSYELFVHLLPVAFLVGFISFVESFSVAKTLADKEKEQLDPNQELVSLGLANMGNSFVSTIPVAGAISRTAVNYESGAKSKLSLLITALLMIIAIFYLTPLFYYLPKTTLAAIIIYAVINLIQIKQLQQYLKNQPIEAIGFLVTLLSTLIWDVFIGLAIGVLFSVGKRIFIPLEDERNE
ncbi:sulfate permease, SulP family [Oceanobacillus limi]|uniref:Sulfate permease, SulP family n=1 Tax=Oceanobacillus limi TaxID=930131 RepID=A0A1I0A501_9BACI|nr:SulP family inorganic anion transporter [Oceanobacillus limi]SES89168.1 sulfate permease, SulP family [Oceanobacillus limi]